MQYTATLILSSHLSTCSHEGQQYSVYNMYMHTDSEIILRYVVCHFNLKYSTSDKTDFHSPCSLTYINIVKDMYYRTFFHNSLLYIIKYIYFFYILYNYIYFFINKSLNDSLKFLSWAMKKKILNICFYCILI